MALCSGEFSEGVILHRENVGGGFSRAHIQMTMQAYKLCSGYDEIVPVAQPDKTGETLMIRMIYL